MESGRVRAGDFGEARGVGEGAGMYEATPALLQVIGGTGASVAEETQELSADARLVAAVRAGDREAFARLYDAYGRMVHGILLARVPYGEVDDLVQDVFLTALRKIDSLRDDGSFGAWLAMITRNRAMDFHRRSRETTEIEETHAQTQATQGQAVEVLNLIRLLPEAYREPMILRFVEGMTGPEIAERTGLAPASVRVNIHRGMKMLREKLSVSGEERLKL
ncbi:MAG: sigma-70 family RNA polymerase sigma factor [Acidobacteria bacterium]|nr:sigma-70 family RNA polymerase sigma factor [Acidobacteriota bacterium]